MPRYKGAHLTWNDRLTIEKMLREGYSKPQIAAIWACITARSTTSAGGVRWS